MVFGINAWIDRPDPFISVFNRESGQELARFDKQHLEVCLQKGELCLQDFCHADAEQQQVLIKDLLLLRCCYVMQKEIEALVPWFSGVEEGSFDGAKVRTAGAECDGSMNNVLPFPEHSDGSPNLEVRQTGF